ncbi:hypothetical protein NPIL_19341 [Nephila pilipes]|uniref:Uncharacterized protein n=1 Tax=Nephila pilipes TaxID=299642 RepID=A0A8X6UEC3_NEPPI|nr:hypothetical protein NPIL_19341 [Nephila pilipes]
MIATFFTKYLSFSGYSNMWKEFQSSIYGTHAVSFSPPELNSSSFNKRMDGIEFLFYVRLESVLNGVVRSPYDLAWSFSELKHFLNRTFTYLRVPLKIRFSDIILSL